MQNFLDKLDEFTEFMLSGQLQSLFIWAVFGCMLFELGRRWMGYEPFFTLEEKEEPLPHTVSVIFFLLLLCLSASIFLKQS